LSELESEKNLKSHDVRMQQILTELRQRCRGYKGQLYELVKPINSSYDIAVKVSL
jgi:chromosome segregation ATPase